MLRFVQYIILISIAFDGFSQSADNQSLKDVKRIALSEVITTLESTGIAKISHSLDQTDLQKLVLIEDDNYELDHLLKLISEQCQLEYMRIGDQIVLRRSSLQPKKPKELVATKQPIPEQQEISKDTIRKVEPTNSIDIKTFQEELAKQVEDKKAIKYKKNEHKLNYTDELISIDGNLTGTQILLKALTKLKHTYHSKPLLLSGVYSEVLEEDGKTALFVESLVDIYDKGYNYNSDDQLDMKEEVFIRNVRKSNNYIHPHIFGNIENFNSLEAVLRWNKVKYKSDELPDRIVSEAYETEGVVSLDRQPVYKVSFKENKMGVVYRDTYYIDISSFSIVRFEKESSANPGYYLENQFKLVNKNNLLFKLKDEYTFYEFEALEGKIYLSKAGSGGSAHIVSSKTNSVLFELDIQRDLKIESIKSTRRKPSKKSKMDPSKSIYSQAGKYDPELWQSSRYNYINVLSGEQILELEKEKKLDSQFSNN